MDEREIFVLADEALARVVGQIRDDQWGMTMPPDFLTMDPDRVWTLREIIRYHAFDDVWVPDMLAGRTMEEAGTDKFDGDLLGDDPKQNFMTIVATACAAARALDDLDRTVHCSFGDFSAREYLWQIISFRGLRARDISKVIGIPVDLPPELVQALWDGLSPRAEEWRGYGVFPAAIPVPEDAPLLDRVLGLTGRQP